MEIWPFRFGRHLVVALAIGLLAPFRLWAWPSAIASGIVIGIAGVEKRHGQTVSVRAPRRGGRRDGSDVRARYRGAPDR